MITLDTIHKYFPKEKLTLLGSSDDSRMTGTAIDIARLMSNDGEPVHYFSIQQKRERFEKWENKHRRTKDSILTHPLFTFNDAVLNIDELCNEIEKIDASCIIIDYIGLVDTPLHVNTRAEELLEICERLDELAQKKGKRIIALHLCHHIIQRDYSSQGVRYNQRIEDSLGLNMLLSWPIIKDRFILLDCEENNMYMYKNGVIEFLLTGQSIELKHLSIRDAKSLIAKIINDKEKISAEEKLKYQS